jgi:Zn-dependent M28 family amino/carboxypeptidase
MQSRRMKGVLLVLVLLFIVFLFFSYWYMMKCEGNWKGEPLEKQMKAELSKMKKGMELDIEYLQKLGPRNSENDTSYKQLRQSEEWIREKWESQGYTVKKQTFSYKGKEYSNLEIEIKGRIAPSEIIIVSAQYDTLPDSPGANNNGSGLAILFQLSQLLRKHNPERTLRLLNFVNEEDPFFGTEMMGSYQYAKSCRQRVEDIRVMLSLDALGVYKDEPGSQRLPFPFSIFYPDRGNFLAFIGNLQSRKYMVEVSKGFKKGSSFPIKVGVAPEWAKGAAWSDHSSFWKFGYPGIMVTDTGGFRSPYHTTKEDTMEKLNFEAMSRIVIGMYTCGVHLTSLQK